MSNIVDTFQIACLFFSIALVCSGEAIAIESGQIDDFEDGTEQNWIWGRSGFGGPVAFSGDPAASTYLETESFGGDDAPGSRMAILNREQWTGDFLAAGVTAIHLDAVNDGPNFAFDDMTVRIAFSSSTATIGSGRVVTSEGFLLSRDAGWQQLEFDLTDLVAVAGSDIPEVMSSVSEMRILSAVEPEFIGDQILARLGVDNITAVTVPEPKVWPIGCLLVAFVVSQERRRRCKRNA